MKKNLTKIIFSICIIPFIGFYIWSNLLSISILLILILDSFTIKIIPTQIKKLISNSIYQLLKYAYVIILPVIFAIFFRTFFFDVYYVPSSSMERTLFPGDYVVVNKISYGVKVPNHLRNIPVIGGLFNPPKKEYNLYTSLKPLKKFQREDIVVFKAVDNSHKFLIKRIIGAPNDTIQIKQSKVFINSKELIEKDNYAYNYVRGQNERVLLFENYSNKEFLELSEVQKNKYKKDIKEKPNYNYFIFPFIKQEKWTRDNYGKLIVPKKGMKIKLTEENINTYKSVVLKFENVNLKKLTKQFYYTFKNDYYFVMGDNRHNSIDSRSFGFVPKSYIQGKMVSVFSKPRLLN
jgi:signal peptidase I